jgi:hypothetical protein
MLASLAGTPSAEAAPCGSPGNNEIVEENCKTGSPASEWEVTGAGDSSIQGFATDISVAQGATVHFKVDTDASDYRLDIYRMGYYGGSGARLIATVQPSAVLPQSQPPCAGEPASGLVDCGNWSESASWPVPADSTSGIYFARLVRESGVAGASHVVFVVRDDDGASDLLFQTSDTTWQAYNAYGGSSLYTGGPSGRAYKVSYDRPVATRDNAPEDSVFNSEYPMVRWLERNGYDVSYFTGADSDRLGPEMREHAAFLSVGHDEYWSGSQRRNLEAARDAGVSLAFLSGNEGFWKTRWEDGHRTLVSYKETHANSKIDPEPGVWTGTWRDGRPFNPEGARPENALTGTAFMVNAGSAAMRVPAQDGRLRLWRGTDVAEQAPGGVAALTDDTVGYEWDEDLDNGARPAGLMHLSTTTVSGVERLQDLGSTYAPGTATHHLTLYRDTNGAGKDALVFGAGTVQWSWGLDGEHERGASLPNASMQQATVNLLADMGVQPMSLQDGLAAATASSDTTPPMSTVTAPADGSTVQQGTPVVVRGTAGDAGGRVGAVEVSVDDGATWHPATGREAWSYAWTPDRTGALTVLSRAADDSGNLGATSLQGPADQPPADGTPPTVTVVPNGSVPGAKPGISPPAPGPSGGADPGTPGADRVAPRVRVTPRRTRGWPDGTARLRVACPTGEQRCRVTLSLLLAGRRVAVRTLTVPGGRTRGFTLVLSRGARRTLLRRRSLRVIAVATARDLAGNRASTRTPIRLVTPSPEGSS